MAGPAWLLGVLGEDAQDQARGLWEASGLTVSSSVDSVAGAGLVATSDGWMWSHTPLPAGIDPARARLHLDAATLRHTPSGWELRTGVSGAQGIFWSARDGNLAVASHPAVLATPGMPPDWDAWAHIIGFGGPLGPRTPWGGVRRLQADEALSADTPGRWRVERRSWEFRDADPPGRGDVREIGAAVEAAVARLPTPMQVPLSGGLDSRVLAVAAARRDHRITAWTTSKDDGTIQEELIARAVARRLGIPHTLVTPRADGFEEDFLRYARLVGHSAPFHVWALALADRLGERHGVVLDGLGGVLFRGTAIRATGAAGSPADRRFAASYPYVPSAAGVLRKRVEDQVRARCLAGYLELTGTVQDHPDADALSVFLCTITPGISWGPFGVMASGSRVAAPLLDRDVVLASRAVRRAQPDLAQLPRVLAHWDLQLASIRPTARPVMSRRLRPSRGASATTARAFRRALLGSPVAGLLSERLQEGSLEAWRATLASIPARHVLQSLWLLADWIDRHEPTGATPDVLLERVG